MNPFNFHVPATVAEAVALLKARPDAKLLAGGHSLIPVLKLEMAAPTDLISLAKIPDLKDIRVDGPRVIIGALCTHAQVAQNPEVRAHVPALARLAAGIGDPQVRNRGTLGGSIAHADPSADYPAAVLGLGATIKTDRRTIEADAYFTGLFQTALAPDELITSVSFPVPEKAAYAKFASHASGYATVGVFVARLASGVRVAVTGAGPTVFRVSAMEAALAKSFTPAAVEGLSVPAADLNSDLEASAEYRAHLVSVMAARAVQAA